jgi:c(7)-type cytochrome triheme protein
VIFKRDGQESGELPPAVFPHWVHRSRYTCYACHPAPFEMKAGMTKLTMDDIMAGKFCATCHDGKAAWAVNFETCNRCHKQP